LRDFVIGVEDYDPLRFSNLRRRETDAGAAYMVCTMLSISPIDVAVDTS